MEDKKEKNYSAYPQQAEKKATKPVVAERTCTVELENATVILVKGDEVHGLTRQERDHLKAHGFIK